MSTSNNIPKYRPSFTAAEIIELHSYLTHVDKNLISDPSIYDGLVSKIATLTFKLGSGIATPAYNTTAKKSLLESLGGTKEPIIDAEFNKDRYNEDSEDDWAAEEKAYLDKQLEDTKIAYKD